MHLQHWAASALSYLTQSPREGINLLAGDYIFCASHEVVTLDLTYLNHHIGRRLGHGRSPVALHPSIPGELGLVACRFGTWDQKGVLSPQTNNSPPYTARMVDLVSNFSRQAPRFSPGPKPFQARQSFRLDGDLTGLAESAFG